jgi:hypothetical protein
MPEERYERVLAQSLDRINNRAMQRIYTRGALREVKNRMRHGHHDGGRRGSK